jgi:hypothetical protein
MNHEDTKQNGAVRRRRDGARGVGLGSEREHGASGFGFVFVFRSDPTTPAGLRSRPAVEPRIRVSVTLRLCGQIVFVIFVFFVPS